MAQTFQDAVNLACQEPTLTKALSWIAVWECERVTPVAHAFLNDKENKSARGFNGQGWDTCFEYLIKEVMEHYTLKRLKGK
jgi:hypothetical protein